MKKLNMIFTKKQLIILCISLVIIVLSSFSYALFLSIDNRDEDIVTTECFKLSFEDSNDINLDKAYPMSDSEGNQLTPCTFTIKNVCNRAGDYQVNIETKEESSLSTAYLRYKLDNNTPDILGNQLEVQEYINDNISESRNIAVGVILPNEEITYNLRLWLDENATVSQSANKVYKGKVVVKTIENKAPYQTIALNADGGNISTNQIIRVKTRQIGELDEPVKEDYQFLGWYLDSNFNEKVEEDTIVTDSMDNLYAKWYKIVYRYVYTGASQTFTAPDSGEYKIELWGAGSKGAYTSGNITLGKGTSLYVMVGQNEIKNEEGVNWNGGGATTFLNEHYRGYSGGGATDVRTISNKGVWNNASALRSRIMVAAGSGGYGSRGGAGGGLTGYSGTTDSGTAGTGANQTTGGTSTNASNGAFGIGATSVPGSSTDLAGSGGGGYYGGGAGYATDKSGGGGGGSSYISGHTGCVAITELSNVAPLSGCTTGNTNNTCSVHYTSLHFTNTKMIDGIGYSWTNTKGSLEQMPNPLGGYYSSGSGHSGNGYAKITYLGNPQCIAGDKRNFVYQGSQQMFSVPCDGTYKIELWGAEGQKSYDGAGGKGAYTSGQINLTTDEKLYVYVGSTGTVSKVGYNGGGICHLSNTTNCGGAGGGATDVRLITGTWSVFDSLKSRIMVAAGGGGAGGAQSDGTYTKYYSIPGAAGGLTGYASGATTNYDPSSGGTQTSGGYNTRASGASVSDTYGSFGMAPQETDTSCCGAGGGGGYYGGGGGCGTSAGGGSSFISGYSGCNAIAEASTESNVVHTNQPNHYSGKVFTNGVMRDGKGCTWASGSAAGCGAKQVQPNGTNATGHSGNGYARITYLGQ